MPASMIRVESEVRNSEMERDKRMRMAFKCVKNIAVARDKVLSRVMRNSDLIRNDIWEALRSEVKLASECITIFMEKSNKEEEGVYTQANKREKQLIRILYIAGLAEILSLRNFLDKTMMTKGGNAQ